MRREYDPRQDPQRLPCNYSSCGAVPTRKYAQGDRCPAHTPAALDGLPEPGATASPYRPQLGVVQATSTVLDDRAIASGKRRSNPDARREAKAREEARRG